MPSLAWRGRIGGLPRMALGPAFVQDCAASMPATSGTHFRPRTVKKSTGLEEVILLSLRFMVARGIWPNEENSLIGRILTPTFRRWRSNCLWRNRQSKILQEHETSFVIQEFA